MPPKISIILCTYNESNYIKETIFELQKNIPNLELIIVDDNSTDGTIEIINEINKDNKINLIIRKKKRGLGSAFLRGLIETSGDYIGWLDTNMSELIPSFNVMSNLLSSDNDIVQMSRYINGGFDKRNKLRSLSSKYFNFFCRLVLRGPVTDYTSGIFLMKRKILNEITIFGYGHGDFYIEFMYSVYKKGFKIKEIPFEQNKDDNLGVSKSAPNMLNFIFLGIKYFVRVLTSLLKRN